MNPLIGKKVLGVYLADDGQAIKFDVENGSPIIAQVDADCCSHTWIEYVETPENMLGIVTMVENIDMPVRSKDIEYGLIQFYGCKIHTEKGSSLLDYRNESNGYYGGNLSWPGEHYYGGVFGQNISAVLRNEGYWRKIA